MRKHQIFITCLVAAIMLLTFASSAFADVVDLGNGYTVERTVTVSGKTNYKNSKTGDVLVQTDSKTSSAASGSIALGSGTGGYTATSGYRYITTKITYKFLNSFVMSSEAQDFYRFKSGKVYDGQHVYLHIKTLNPAFYRTIRQTQNTPARLPYSGHAYGQVYFSSKTIVRCTLSWIGEIWEMRPMHENYGRYNGTYYWRTTYY